MRIIVLLLLLALPAQAADLFLTDEHPVRVGHHAYGFSVKVPVVPVGLTFAAAQYNFAAPTNGISVDYLYDGHGIDWSDPTCGIAYAPTLYDAREGPIQGWLVSDLRGGIVRGIVYSTAPLTEVYVGFEAAGFVPRH